ncbi:hypothetical protein COW53_07215 [bacterium CG17_big_fil_post_rev_8_21_14_2_50_64_8]|nr:MAG: hypothetical protein COW53_07215 [bacterium CG17_big_fil_post_rev_8_21_14_2_50_64_8]
MPMKLVTLERDESTDQGTFGKLIIPGCEVIYETLELPWRNNQASLSCIPSGRYQIAFAHSYQFHQKMIRVLDVVGRRGILIHAGNFAGDIRQGWDTNVQGCILVGTCRGIMQNTGHQPQAAVLDSRAALAEVEALLMVGRWDMLIRPKWRTSTDEKWKNAQNLEPVSETP